MLKNSMEQIFQAGVSVIISAHNRAENIDRLLYGFLLKNTHRPCEIIVMDLASSDNTEKVVEKYAEEAFFVYIKSEKDCSLAVSSNFAARKAVYPNLLFLGNAIYYNEDFLPWAVKKLLEPNTGAVGGYVDKNCRQCLPKKAIGSWHEGINIWPDEAGKDEDIVMADAFLFFCRRDYFNALHGFSEHSKSGFEFVDFCLELRKKFDKKSYFADPFFLSLLLAWFE